MKTLAITVVSLITLGCAVPESPVAPSPPPLMQHQIVPSVLRASFGPPEVYTGGATQIHVAVMGHDANETLQRISDVHVAFSTNRERLTVLHGRTTMTNDAVALLEVGRSLESYTVTVRVEAAGMAEVLHIPVCACRP